MTTLFFETALLPGGWAHNVAIAVEADGQISGVTADAERPASGAAGRIAVPGLANLHSHAFQRAMAGLGEWRGSAADGDSFWTWREVMYRFLGRLTPDDVRAIAAQLYVEMAEAGFTSVGEFHYLHHQPDGTPYDDLAEMAGQIAAAADIAGLGLTLLPVYYEYGGFVGQAPGGAQARFVNDPDRFLVLYEECRRLAANHPGTIVGAAPHSLRAVTPDSLQQVVGACSGPLHIHVAEQTREVDDCVSALGVRPVEWLLDNQHVDERWCLIHATHMTDAETRRLAETGAVAGLCPITEANLGDGIFNGVVFHEAGGRWGVGSDSNVRIDLAEELRSLEYSQRLRDRGRNRLVPEGAANGRALFDAAVAGGNQALARPAGGITAGLSCDLVSLDADHPALAGRNGDDLLNGWIFSGDKGCVGDVWIGGHHIVQDGRHVRHETVLQDFRQAMERLGE